jgi:hypothetical protein
MRHRPHRALVGVLLLVATVATIAGAGARWVNTQLLKTPEWTSTSERLIADPAVRRAVSDFTVRRALGDAGIDAALSRVLGATLAGVAQHELRTAAGRAADTVLSSSGGRRAWRDANHQAVSGLLAAVDHPRRNAGVSLQLTPLLDDIVSGIARDPVVHAIPGISTALSVATPDAGRLRILTPAQVRDARTGVRVVHVLSWAPLLGALALALLALTLARDWRTIALGRIGYALAIAGAVMLGVRTLIRYPLADGVVSSATDRAAVRATWLISSGQLRVEAIGLLVVGAVVVALSAQRSPGSLRGYSETLAARSSAVRTIRACSVAWAMG